MTTGAGDSGASERFLNQFITRFALLVALAGPAGGPSAKKRAVLDGYTVGAGVGTGVAVGAIEDAGAVLEETLEGGAERGGWLSFRSGAVIWPVA